MVHPRIQYDKSAKYKVKDFLKKGILITGVLRWKDYRNIPNIRVFFRGENLFAEIRTTCYGNTFAVDISKANNHWYHRTDSCLTTECKTLQEAKNIVWAWFESENWHKEPYYNTYFTPMSQLSHYKPIIEYFLK